jgi:GDSL-like lipase/acylhydrolase family protein
MIRTLRFSAAFLGVLLVGACHNDELNRPFADTPVDPLFARYVSMGNSITAGVQSGGINDSTQQLSYAVVLARAMRSPFYPPLLNKPGCPPPYTNVWIGARVGGGTATTCALREIPPNPPPYISNTAVPSAEVIDIYKNVDTAANANPLTQFFLGGLTQVQMMAKAQATFVSVWIGNNDVLGAATSSTNPGDSTAITPVAVFQNRYDSMTSAVAAAKPKGAILIGVANVTDIPFFSAGATYWAIKNKLALPDTFPTLFTVSANCAPGALAPGVGRGDTTLVPFPYGAALLAAASPPNNQPRNLDCADSVVAVVTPPELRKLVGTLLAYNAHISAQATANHWAYLDPNPTLDSLKTVATAVRPFPRIGQPCSANPFGTAFSCDGVHPSTASQKLIAQKLRAAINSAYTTAIPAIP